MVGIILYGSFELAPYSKMYMRILDDLDIQYDLIGWKREEKTEYTGENVFIYEGPAAKRFSSPADKIKPALGYRKYIMNIIKKRNYDKLIILTTQTAVILADMLLGKYKKKYIFDYRDKSYEYLKPYGMVINGLIKSSAETVLSSPWFRTSLTKKKDYIIVHNFREELLKNKRESCEKKNPGERIIIGYVGALRSYEYHKSLFDVFGSDSRFELHTYGCGDDCDRLYDYSCKFDNVFVYGAYSDSEKYEIIYKFDMMLYNYPYSFVNDGAVANKYYDSLLMKKPMIVNNKTKIGRFIEDNGLGVSIDESCGNAPEKVYEWYKSFDSGHLVKRCDELIEKYLEDNRAFEKRIRELFLK